MRRQTSFTRQRGVGGGSRVGAGSGACGVRPGIWEGGMAAWGIVVRGHSCPLHALPHGNKRSSLRKSGMPPSCPRQGVQGRQGLPPWVCRFCEALQLSAGSLLPPLFPAITGVTPVRIWSCRVAQTMGKGPRAVQFSSVLSTPPCSSMPKWGTPTWQVVGSGGGPFHAAMSHGGAL